MAKNPNLISVPCHKVVKTDGSIGNYALGKDKKIQLLKKEGISFKENKLENFEEILYKFNNKGTTC
jgi:methylated-DNA-[protein]-cysteine S-methyltransferase